VPHNGLLGPCWLLTVGTGVGELEWQEWVSQFWLPGDICVHEADRWFACA